MTINEKSNEALLNEVKLDNLNTLISQSLKFNNDTLDRALKSSDNTISFFKVFFGLLGFLSVLIGILVNSNLKDEKEKLDKQFQDLKKEIQKNSDGKPKLELLGQNMLPLNEQILKFEPPFYPVSNCQINDLPQPVATPIYTRVISMSFAYVIRNIGNAPTDNIWLSLYHNNAEYFETFGNKPTDEGKLINYNITDYSNFKKDSPFVIGNIPGGGFVLPFNNYTQIKSKELPAGKYEILVKMHYGKNGEETIKAKFYIQLDTKWVAPPDCILKAV